MPFGLKNVGASFQRVMRACLGTQMGRNMEAYIVVKFLSQDTLIRDLEETINNLRWVKFKLNP